MKVWKEISGIPETTNPSQIEFGADRFKQFLETEQSTSADHFADRLLKELSQWSVRDSGEEKREPVVCFAFPFSGSCWGWPAN